jgi:hypothetical protein
VYAEPFYAAKMSKLATAMYAQNTNPVTFKKANIAE